MPCSGDTGQSSTPSPPKEDDEEEMSDDVDDVKSSGSGGGGHYRNPVEGPAMLAIGVVGTLLNLLCLCALRRTRELKLSSDYLFLLRMQSAFDLAYLVTSTPVTALPYAFPSFRVYYEPHVLPYVFPFVQVRTIMS